MTLRFLAALPLLALGCHTHDLTGSWALCLTATPSPSACGTAHVQSPRDLGKDLTYSRYYPLTYRIDLRAIIDSSHLPLTHCGSVLVARDGSITVQLGIRCDAVFEADGGELNAEHLTLTGDSLAGRWYQGCFSGCSAHGGLTMRRAR